jgi:hypothetical protein
VTTSNEIPTVSTVLNNLTLGKSGGVTFGSNATANGTVAINSGSLDQGATFNLTASTISVSSGATYQNFGTGDLTLGSGGVSNAGTIVFNANGATCADADSILIRSSSPGTARTWSGAGTFSMTDVDVQDQKVPVTPPPLAIIATSSTNSGGNTGWVFTGDASCTSGTYTWSGGASQDWTIATNWSPTRTTPSAADVLVIDGNVTSSPTITNVANVVGNNETIAKLRVLNGATPSFSTGAANTLTINAGAGVTGLDLGALTIIGSNALTISVASGTLGTVTGTVVVQGGAHRLIGNAAGAITFQSGAIFTTNTGFTGNAFGTATAGSVVFASGSNYFHNAGNSPFGTGAAVVVFQTGSTANYLIAGGFDANGRTYANLVIGNSSTPVSASDSGTGAFQFDNLTVNSTASTSSSLTYQVTSGSAAITIQGNITSNGTGNTGTLPDVFLTPGSSGVSINKSGTVNFTNDGSNARAIDFEGNASVTNGTTLALARVVELGVSNPHTRTLIVNSTGNITGSASGYLIGGLQKIAVPATFIFPVGTPGAYSPVDLANASGGGDLTVVTRTPNQTVLAPATSLHRYWTLTKAGSLTADLTFHYVDGDVFGNENNYRLVIVEGGNATSYPADGVNVIFDAANNKFTRKSVQTFSDWTAAEPVSPTAVKLTSFNATRSGSDVWLRWQTGYEVRNLGYNIYREQNGVRTLITPTIVAGSALLAGRQTELTAGLSYSWQDQVSEVSGQKSEGSGGVSYWLEDIDLDGTKTLHGPIGIAEDRNQRSAVSRQRSEDSSPKSAERSPVLGEVRAAGERGVFVDAWPSVGSRQKAESSRQKAGGTRQEAGGSGTLSALSVQQGIAATPGVKLAVSKTGWFRVTQGELVAAGLDPNVNAANLQLFANAVEAPFKVSGNGVQFTSSDYIEFYGHGISSSTDPAQTYYLVPGSSAGQRIPTLSNVNPLAPPSGPTGFDYTVEQKERRIYFSGLLNGDAENFFGRIVSTTPVNQTVTAAQLDLTSAPAQLEVVLQGVTAGTHTVSVRFNSTDLGTITFANTDHPVQTLSVPAAALLNGGNAVQLSGLGGSGDVSLIDTLRLTYAHTFVAENNALYAGITNGGTTRVSGFTAANVRAIDITDPGQVQELATVVTQQPDSSYTADLRVDGASAGSPHTLLVFADGTAAHPDSITHNNPSTWNANTNGADYLIVTTDALAANLEPLAALRRARGMQVNIVDVADLYDEFSFGMHTPYAVHDFLQLAAATWRHAPHFVLFAGDSSYDPKNYFARGFNDQVPSKLIDTTQTETASDDWLADFNNDGISDLAIGRLPARTPAEVNTMVNKIISFENTPADPSRGALLVADRTFEAASTSLQNALPAGLPVQTINRSSSDDTTIHNQIVNGINQGPRITNYFGHGSNGVWTSAFLLSNQDAPALTNTNKLSLFTMMTCYNGYFQDALSESLSESLLKSPGGAVAVWASTSLTEPGGQSSIDEEFYRQVFGNQAQTLGDSVRAAKGATTDSDVRRTWTLFGDPAMYLVSITPTATNGSVGGKITDASGRALAGTTIALSGAQNRTTITDSNGSYSFDNLETNGFYTVTPARAGYGFNPASRSFSLLGLHTDASFTATASATQLNPLDAPDYFVRQQYLDFLGREPDESGFNFWSNQIRACGMDAGCIEAKRINTSAAFFLSIEFQQTGYLVYRTYKSAYGNSGGAPVPLKLDEFLPDTREIGNGVIVNKTGWEQALENNKQAFMAEFVQRSRFASAYPVGLTPPEFVDRLFANAGVTPAGSERSDAIGEFASATNTSDLAARARVLRRISENPALGRKEFNSAFVLMQYFGYLRRNPNDVPEATLDYRGYNFWLDKLNSFNGNFANAEMVKAFILSAEYRQRFGQ